MRIFRTALAVAATLVMAGATPAMADSQGRYSIAHGNKVKASGPYFVNERAGDTRVWFKGNLTNNAKHGCAVLRAGSSDSKINLKKHCGRGSVPLAKYVTMGVFSDSAQVQVCHQLDDSLECGRAQTIKY
ncbi:hypothetical protein G5C51_10670 [Streptomyces sp. A7024]|uniref:Secreted protein n=1 Tax=Streptomyces coryli TaxID=1128680 RepID=A0A6G4TWK5_9ACTN|nr:hypothetical protein [Streptomyces coryli]NGN64365.1 hypothetical protein [Streptomyces coryli]